MSDAGWVLEIRKTDSERWDRREFRDGDAALEYLAQALSGREHDWLELRLVTRGATPPR